MQLVSLAVNADTSKINRTVFEQLSKNTIEQSENEITEEVESSSAKGITEKDLEELENLLSKQLSPTQTKHAMNIFRGFRDGASAKEKEAALVIFTI